MQGTTTPKQVMTQDTFSSEKILVPTVHGKPLRLRESNEENARRKSNAENSSGTMDGEPFLYYTVSTNHIGGMRYARENEDDVHEERDTTECKTNERRRSRYSVETHPMTDLMMFFKIGEDDIEVED